MKTRKRSRRSHSSSDLKVPFFSENDRTGTHPFFQAKLRIGAPDNRFERDADAVANHLVSHGPAPVVQRTCGECARESQPEQHLRRQPLEEEEEQVQAKADPVQRPGNGGGGTVDASLGTAIDHARGGGKPLTDDVLVPMEQAFGTDFGGVRIHSDDRADTLSRSLDARAFTTGRDIFFRKDEYQPATREGKRLLAHELTHVVQGPAPSLVQRQGKPGSRPTSRPTARPAVATLSGMRTMAETYINAYHTAANSGLTLFLTDMKPSFNWGSFWLAVGGNVVWAAAAFTTGPYAFVVSLAGIAINTAASQNVVKSAPDFRKGAISGILTFVTRLKNQIARVTKDVHSKATSGKWNDNRVRLEILHRMFGPKSPFVTTFKGGFPSVNSKAVAASVREQLLLRAAKSKGTTGAFGNIGFGPGRFEQRWTIDAIEYIKYPFHPLYPTLKPRSKWLYGLKSAKMVNVSPHFKDINKSLNAASRDMGRPNINVVPWPIEKRLILQGRNARDPFYFEYHFDSSSKLTKTVLSSHCRAFFKVRGYNPDKYAAALLRMIQGWSRKKIPGFSQLGP